MTVLRSGSATDVGRVRTVNQDMPLERPDLYAVADGMGGHVGGEVAARVAVETLDRAFEHAPTVDGLRAAFSEANSAVWQESLMNADLRGMGTTLTAMALVGGTGGKDVLALANVGDSRAYVFSDGELTQVTDDHSLAEERMRHGEMTEEEAAVHPQRHILTRALGVSSEVQADMWELELRTGDRVLLCSDGLSNEVSTEEMAEILGEVDDPDEAARRLVDAANEHGGADNITVVIVDVQVGDDGRRGEVQGHAHRARGRDDRRRRGDGDGLGVGCRRGGSRGHRPRERGPSPRPATRPRTLSGVRPDDTLAPGSRLGFRRRAAGAGGDRPAQRRVLLGRARHRCPLPVRRRVCRRPLRAWPGSLRRRRRRAGGRAGVASAFRGASPSAWSGSFFCSRRCPSPRTSCSVGTPTTTGSSPRRANRSW